MHTISKLKEYRNLLNTLITAHESGKLQLWSKAEFDKNRALISKFGFFIGTENQVSLITHGRNSDMVSVARLKYQYKGEDRITTLYLAYPGA